MESSLLCYICGKYFAGPFHKKHLQQCLGSRNEQIEDLQKQIPNIEIPPIEEPQMVVQNTNDKEAISAYNDRALDCFQKAFVPCPKCKKTFHIGRIEVHFRNCKTDPLDLAQAPGRKKRLSRDEGQKIPTPRRSMEADSSTPERPTIQKKKSFNASDDELLSSLGTSHPNTGRARPMSSPNVLETTSPFDKLDAMSYAISQSNLNMSSSSNGSSDSLEPATPDAVNARRSYSVGANVRQHFDNNNPYVRKMVGGFETKDSAPDKQKLIGHVRASLTLLKQRIQKGSSVNHGLQHSLSSDAAISLYKNTEELNKVVRLPQIEKLHRPKNTFPKIKKTHAKFRFAYQGKDRTKPVLKLPNIHNPTRIPILKSRYSHYYHTFPKDRVNNHIFVLQSWLDQISKSEEENDEVEENEEAQAEENNEQPEPEEPEQTEEVLVPVEKTEPSKPVESEKQEKIEATKQSKIEQLKKRYSNEHDEDGTRFPPLRAPSKDVIQRSLPEKRKEDPGLPRYCSKCGAKFPGDGPNYRFCGACGQERRWREPHTVYQHFYAEPRIVEERVR